MTKRKNTGRPHLSLEEEKALAELRQTLGYGFSVRLAQKWSHRQISKTVIWNVATGRTRNTELLAELVAEAEAIRQREAEIYKAMEQLQNAVNQ